ncbi:MAG: hypothetical protein AAFN77_14440 [Planctomycetota bacterium]
MAQINVAKTKFVVHCGKFIMEFHKRLMDDREFIFVRLDHDGKINVPRNTLNSSLTYQLAGDYPDQLLHLEITRS